MLTIRELVKFPKNKVTTQDIGFEIEVEGDHLPSKLSRWRITRDGSLRGEGAREFVLARPSSYKGFCQALNELSTSYTTSNSRVTESVRAGVHAHINVQELTLVQLFNFITLSVLVEELLAEFCGKTRIGNLFCLRCTDASYLVKVIQNVANTGNLNLFYEDDIRYSFVNLKSIIEHGSVEFRAMRSTTDFKVLKDWIRILLQIKKSSLEFNNPEDIIAAFSDGSLQEFRQRIFGKHYDLLDFQNADVLLFNGMRNAQDIAYSANWTRLSRTGMNNPFKTASSKESLIPDIQPEPPRLRRGGPSRLEFTIGELNVAAGAGPTTSPRIPRPDFQWVNPT